jgi:hypothetical protein
VTAALVVLVALSGCSDDDQSGGPEPTVVSPTTTTTTTVVEEPAPDVTLTVTGADVVGPGGPTHPLVDPTLSEMVGVVDRFLDVTSLHPLTGRPGPGLAEVMTDDAAQQATTTDRGTVFDEGVPVSPGVEAVEATVALRALAGPANDLELVVVALVWDVRGAVGVRRTGELTIVPTAAGWRISAYDLVVTRS